MMRSSSIIPTCPTCGHLNLLQSSRNPIFDANLEANLLGIHVGYFLQSQTVTAPYGVPTTADSRVGSSGIATKHHCKRTDAPGHTQFSCSSTCSLFRRIAWLSRHIHG